VAEAGKYNDLIGQTVFQVLLAEVAMQRGDPVFASKAYADLALRTRDPDVLERTVQVAVHARRFDLALEAARLWVQVEPTSTKAQRMLSSVLIMSNQLDDLAPSLIRMLEADKVSQAENLLGLNRMLARNPDRMAVYRLIEKVCRPFFGSPEAHYAVAMAAGSAGESERALAEVRRALELRPDWEMAALLQVQLMTRENPAEAIVFMQDFLERNPKARELQLHLARALVGEKRYDDARRQFELLLKDYPDSPDVVYPVAILALQQNDLALAETQLRHLLTLSVPDKSYAYFFLGQIAEDRKRNDEALAFYAQVSIGDRYIPAQLRSAYLLAAQGKLDAARKLLGGATASSVEDRMQLSIAEAGLLREAKQVQAAYALLDALLASHPDQPELLYETALLAEKLGRLDVLESRLRRLIELRPDSAQAYNALGYSYAERNLRLNEARELIEKALKLSPDDYFILDSMGWVLYRQGDPAGALVYLERAMSKRDDPEVAAHLGEVLWALGRQDEARRVWLEAQQKNQDNEALTETIQKFMP
jgi:Flp pilus assembly protein TadD